jgi:hypothetical protein
MVATPSNQTGTPMRLAVALLLAVVAAAPAMAQKPPTNKPNQPASQSSEPNPSAKPAPLSESEERLRQRILLREKFNKGWNIQPESPQERKARCRFEARKHYSALHPIKRAKHQKECMERPKR